MRVYTEAEFDCLYEETLFYEQIETNLRGFDEIVATKSLWDEGRGCYTNLSSGIKLDVIGREILLDRNQLTEHNDYDFLTAKFYLSGYQNVICPGIDGIAPEYVETKGQNYLFYLPNIKEIEQEFADNYKQMLRIEINVNTIRKLITELHTVPTQLQRLIEDENPQRFHSTVGGITPQMETIIKQIWQHPYQGA